ncbi:peroxide stress protein YaaA [Brachybacterium endophyticum]|uniref:peroxide stress protein YaaA n=1 Tax=Brachybacterium endophyticum TaxID=2182385 RepID=UPI001401E334|nr:peroxide stress protein YaaA [Brachybacterium endophyticum]
MLILLPPSETKTRPEASAPPLDLGRPGRTGLGPARETMLRAAAATARGREAQSNLGVPAGAPELVERMRGIHEEPAAPPLQVYSGVLYDQLEGAGPGPDRQVLVQSALLGLVDAGSDRIPAYRLSAGSTLHRLGKAASWWRPHLRPVVPRLLEEVAASPSPLVLDCRSGAYRTMMPVRSTDAVRVLEVAPVQEKAGRRSVISHDAKRYRGVLTRVLLEDPRAIPDAEALVAFLAETFAGRLDVELDGDRLVLVDRVD